jgi:hypothetical protein
MIAPATAVETAKVRQFLKIVPAGRFGGWRC